MELNKYLLMIIIVVIIGLNIGAAAVGVKILTGDRGNIKRAPAVYNIKRVSLEPEFQKYNIMDQNDNIIAILNLYLEDFQHDFK